MNIRTIKKEISLLECCLDVEIPKKIKELEFEIGWQQKQYGHNMLTEIYIEDLKGLNQQAKDIKNKIEVLYKMKYIKENLK